MSAFLGDGRLIHDPGHNRLPTPPRGQDLGAHRREHGLIAPGSFGHPMMQGLAGGLHALRVQASGHGFHGLPLAGQQQAAAGVFERFLSVPMPCGLGQALHLGSQALLLRAWSPVGASHKTILPEYVTFVTR